MTASPTPLHSVSTATATFARAFPPGTPLNRLARYLCLKPQLTAPARASLIEVGSATHGLGSIIDDSFVGIDVRIDGQPAPNMYPFSYDGGRVPFQNGSFHTTVSVDTLQHVPPANRVDFIKELMRISAAQVVLGFATDEGSAPPARDVEAIFDQLDDWTWRPLPAVGDLVNLVTALADRLPEAAHAIGALLRDDAAALEAWILAGCFGPTRRKGYLVERRHPRAPLVDLGNPTTLINAITCPNCGGATTVFAPGVRCRGCGAGFAPTGEGVFALHRTVIAPRVDARPGLVFALTPDWSNQDWLVLVHNYLHAFPASAPHRLWITIEPRRQSQAAALEMMQPLLRSFGDQPFAELLISDAPPEPGAALPLSSDGARIFDYSSAWFRAQAEPASPSSPDARADDRADAKISW